jgi:hypothetical protein
MPKPLYQIEWPVPRNIADVKNRILSQPYIKGTLENTYGIIGKFRPNKPYTFKDLFDIRFDRSKVKTDFKDWLWQKIRDIYEASDCDDPRIDPLYGKREELWHEALTFFRVYDQRTHPANMLPGYSCEWLSFDTLKNNIEEIKTISRKDLR